LNGFLKTKLDLIDISLTSLLSIPLNGFLLDETAFQLGKRKLSIPLNGFVDRVG
jgi:hypothetical protein